MKTGLLLAIQLANASDEIMRALEYCETVGIMVPGLVNASIGTCEALKTAQKLHAENVMLRVEVDRLTPEICN